MQRAVSAVGLSLLYASAYFLPLLNPYSLYFIPASFSYIIFPSLVCVAVSTPLLIYGASGRVPARWRRAGMLFGASVLTFIAAKSLLDAAGYPWTSLLTLYNRGSALERLEQTRWTRLAIVAFSFPAAMLLVFLLRRSLTKYLRFLSTLGFAFVFLAVYRCTSGDLNLHLTEHAAPAAAAAVAPVSPRRVVWVIFDEMDYRLSLGGGGGALPHFARLSALGVSATQAFTPGRDTLYSVPALLTGTAISGVELSRAQGLNLTSVDGALVPFDQKHSLFERLPGGAQSASVLGFYHPYCRVIPDLRYCRSTYLGNAGRWFDSLLFFSDAVSSAVRFLKWPLRYLPESVLSHFDPMYRVSENTLGHIDRVLADRGSALDYIHVNLPHLPNVYAQRKLQQPVTNEKDAYQQNMVYADQLLGKIISTLEKQHDQQKILLMVSSDHWLRTDSPTPAPVPFIAWEVGADARQARVLTRPLSTVHSADLALGYIDGSLATQAAIAHALESAEFSPTWMSPEGYKYY